MHWIQSLRKIGLKPSIVQLATVSRSDADSAERFWVAYLRLYGARLVNGTDGGAAGYRMSSAARRHLADATYRRWINATQESRASWLEWLAKGRRNLGSDGKGRISAASRSQWATMTPERRATRLRNQSTAQKARSAEVSADLRRLWKDPQYRAKMVQELSSRAKRRWAAMSPEAKRQWRQKLGEELDRRRNMEGPEAGLRRSIVASAVIARRWAAMTPEERFDFVRSGWNRRSADQRATWRHRIHEGFRAYFSDPENIRRFGINSSAARKAYWQRLTTAQRDELRAKMREGWKRRREMQPKM